MQLLENSILYAGNSCQLSDNLENMLEKLSLQVTCVQSVRAATGLLIQFKYNIVIIDNLEMAYRGLDLCRFIRKFGGYSIVMVIMDKPDGSYEEKLFESGADDVILSQHTTDNILFGRIKARLKNAGRLLKTASVIKIKNTYIDLSQRRIRRNDKTYKLNGTMYELLEYFICNHDRIVSREELAKSDIWYESICSEPGEGGKTIDVTVSKLRRIIETKPNKPEIIESVRGKGWKFNLELYR